MPKPMSPTDPKTILTGGGVKTTRTATKPVRRKQSPRGKR
jgi:hypothetical protein